MAFLGALYFCTALATTRVPCKAVEEYGLPQCVQCDFGGENIRVWCSKCNDHFNTVHISSKLFGCLIYTFIATFITAMH